MSQQSDLGFAHRADRIRIQHLAQGRIHRLWNTASVQNLDASWEALAPALVAQVSAAQVAAARQATPYVRSVNRVYSQGDAGFSLAPEAFGGVMLDGREVGPAMYTAVTTAKTGIRSGMSTFSAFEAGANALAVVVGAAIQDMGRQADLTLSGANTYTRYVRVCNGSACSRCAILAGIGSSEDAFLRHVSCQCGAMPVRGQRVSGREKYEVPKGLFDSPESLFDSMSKDQQSHTFTKAGAESIRNGASPISVVNARRGAYGIGYSGHYNIPVPVTHRNRLQRHTIGRKPDGSPLRVWATTEGTTARGAFGKAERARGEDFAKKGRYTRTTSIRLMPEQIVQMAGGNPVRLRELLTRYGYGY